MGWVSKKDEYTAFARQHDKSAILVTKDGWFFHVVAFLASVFTLGKMSRDLWLTKYASTFGPVQAYPATWVHLPRRTIVHETQHTKQMRYCGAGLSPWIGLPIFAILYLLILIPFKLAFFRYWFERGAGEAEWAYGLSSGELTEDGVMRAADRFANKVSGSPYGWAWPATWCKAGMLKAAGATISDYKKRTYQPIPRTKKAT